MNVVSGLRPPRRGHHRRPFAEPDDLAERRAAEADAGRGRVRRRHRRSDRRAARSARTRMLPSMELATEDHSGLIGACDRDYGCIYMNTLSWRTPTTPMPMEINPRKVFERMFGQGGSADGPASRRDSEDRSILDAITQAERPACSAASARRIARRSTSTSRACARSSGASRWRAKSAGRESRRCRRRRPAFRSSTKSTSS